MGWIGAIIQGVTGGIQMAVSMDELSRLPGSKEYSAGSDLETATSMARRVAQQGMTPAERAAAEQGIGTAQSRTQRAMEQRGLGNLAAAVSQIRTTEAMNQLSAQNAQIKRQGLGQYAQLAGQMQSIENQNIQSFNQMLMSQQTALGQSAQAGFKNLAGTGAIFAEMLEGKDGIDKETYTPQQKRQIEQMKQNRPMERTPDSTLTGTPPDEVDYQGMFADAPVATDMRTDQTPMTTDPQLFGLGEGVSAFDNTFSTPSSGFDASAFDTSSAFGGMDPITIQ